MNNERVSNMSWQTLLTRCRKDALWAANKLTVLDKRLEDMEALIFNQRLSAREATQTVLNLEHSISALEKAMKIHLDKVRATKQ